MAAVDVATLEVRVKTTGAQQAEAEIQSLGRKGASVAAALSTAFAGIAGAWLTREFIKATTEAQYSMAQLEAVVRSTGGSAGYTAEQLRDLAEGLQKVNGIGHEATEQALAILVSFDKIGHDVIPRATQAIQDLGTRMGRDFSGAAMQVGKALQDPANGIAMLNRQFRLFNDAQVATLKTLTETGRIAEAQDIILSKLEERFGGAARAARDTLGGALAFLRTQFEDSLEASRDSTGGIIDAINGIAEALPKIRSKIDEFFRGFQVWLIDSDLAVGKFVGDLVEMGQVFAAVMDKRGNVIAAAPEIALIDERHKGIDKELEREAKIRKALLDVKIEEAAGTKRLADNTRELTEEEKKALEEAKKLAAQFAELAAATLAEAVDLHAMRLATLANNRETETAIKNIEFEAEVRKATAKATRDQAAAVRAAMEARESERRQLEDAKNGWEAVAAATEKAVKWMREYTSKPIGSVYAPGTGPRPAPEYQPSQIEEQWLEAARGIQRAFAVTFESIFRDGMDGFEDFGEALVDLFVQIAAQIAAVMAAESLGFDKLLKDIKAGKGLTGTLGTVLKYGGGAVVGAGVGYQSGSVGMGVASGAMAGLALGGPVGAVLGAVGGLAGGLLGHAKKAEEARRAMETAVSAYVAALDQRIEALHGDDVASQRRLLLLKQEADWTDVFNKVGVDNIEVNHRMLEVHRLESEALEEQIAARQKAIADDVAVRELELAGRNDEAEIMRLQIAQAKELKDAQDAGIDTTKLAAIQEQELAAARQKQAEARAKELQSYNDDIAVRELVVEGKDHEAEMMRLDIRQRDEMEKAIKAGMDVEKLATLQAKERAKAEKEYADAMAAAQKSLDEDIAVRTLVVQGRDDEAALMRLQFQQQKEMAEAVKAGLDITALATLQELEYAAAKQAIIDADIAAEKQRQRDQMSLDEDIAVRLLELNGRNEEAKLMRLQIKQRQEMDDAIAKGLDTTALAALHAAEYNAAYTQSLLDAATAAQEAAQKMADARDELEDDTHLQYLRATGKGMEADIAEANAWYEEQRKKGLQLGIALTDSFWTELDAVLAYKLDEIRAKWAAEVQDTAKAAKTANLTDAQRETVKSVNALSETTALRVSDQITTSNVWLAEIAFNTRPLRGDGIATFPGRATTSGGVTVVVQGSVIGTTPEALAAWLSGAMDERQGTTNAATTQRKLGVAVA